MTTKIITTDLGREKIAAAEVAGKTLPLRKMAIGDANGTEYIPTGKEIKLKNEKYRTDIGALILDPNDKTTVIISAVIPENTGGYTIREIGIFDVDGDLICIGICDPIAKPNPLEALYSLVIEIEWAIVNTEVVTFYVVAENFVTYNYLLNQFQAQTHNIKDNAVTKAKLADNALDECAKLAGADFVGDISVKNFPTQGLGIVASGSNANGSWIKYANGLIRQRGLTVSIPAGSKVIITLPVAYRVGYTPMGQVGESVVYNLVSIGVLAATLTTMDVVNNINSSPVGVYWQTEGY